MVLVDWQVLGDLQLLLEKDVWHTRYVSTAKPEFQNVWEVLREVLSGLGMTVSTDSVGLVGFGQDVIKKKKSLVKEVRVLQKMVRKEKAAGKQVEEELLPLKNLVTASDKLAARLTKSDNVVEAARAEVS